MHGPTPHQRVSPSLGLSSNKRVYYRQRDARFFAPFSYVLSFNLTQLPISTMETLLFSLVGEERGGWRASGSGAGAGGEGNCL